MLRIAFLLVLILTALYLSAAAFVLRFDIDRALFPHVAIEGNTTQNSMYRVIGQSGNVMLVRRYGNPHIGCVVFFPGQHGGISSYEKRLFPRYVAQGIAVFALAYPGQDDAPGRSTLGEVQHLAQQALGIVGQICPLNKTVFVGRSLGSMVAAYVAGVAHPAGLILDGTTPSLSSTVLVRLHSRWYLSPIAKLPISKLLSHDYSLIEALSASPPFPVVVFQGTSDDQTPIGALRTRNALPLNSQLVAVDGGTHSNTYLLAINLYIQAALHMLRHQRT